MSETITDDHAATVREVEKSQQELSQALGNLEGVVRTSVDPMTWITAHPFAAIGLAAAAGFLLGRLGRGFRVA